MRFGSERVRRWGSAVGIWVGQTVGARELVLLVGLLLLGYGAWCVSPPAGFLVPGALLVWFTRPIRVSTADELRVLIATELDARSRR